MASRSVCSGVSVTISRVITSATSIADRFGSNRVAQEFTEHSVAHICCAGCASTSLILLAADLVRQEPHQRSERRKRASGGAFVRKVGAKAGPGAADADPLKRPVASEELTTVPQVGEADVQGEIVPRLVAS